MRSVSSLIEGGREEAAWCVEGFSSSLPYGGSEISAHFVKTIRVKKKKNKASMNHYQMQTMAFSWTLKWQRPELIKKDSNYCLLKLMFSLYWISFLFYLLRDSIHPSNMFSRELYAEHHPVCALLKCSRPRMRHYSCMRSCQFKYIRKVSVPKTTTHSNFLLI